MDELSHVHNKCDDLMVKLKALNQAAVDMPTASVVSTLPFITLVITPVHDSTEVRGSEVGNTSEVATTADAVSEELIHYLTNPVAVETNVDSGVEKCSDKENEAVQPVKVNVIINKNGVHQPLKPIGEMLNELNSRKGKGTKRSDHIQESNIIVSTPVIDQCVSEFSMKTKKKHRNLKIGS